MDSRWHDEVESAQTDFVLHASLHIARLNRVRAAGNAMYAGWSCQMRQMG